MFAKKSAASKLLLKERRAKVVHRTLFVVRLLYGSSGYKQKITSRRTSGSFSLKTFEGKMIKDGVTCRKLTLLEVANGRVIERSADRSAIALRPMSLKPGGAPPPVELVVPALKFVG